MAGKADLIHTQGGLGEHWHQVLQADLEYTDVLTDRTRAFGEAVLGGEVADTDFNHRAYLGAHDWRRVGELFGDVLGKGPAAEIGRYALLEEAGTYTLDDYVYDKLNGLIGAYNYADAPTTRFPYVWEGRMGTWIVAQVEQDEAPDPAVVHAQELSPAALANLKDIFMVPQEIALTDMTAPEYFFAYLVERAEADPDSVEARLPALWQRLDVRTDVAASANPFFSTLHGATSLRDAYNKHFGIRPALEYVVYAHDDTVWTMSLNPAGDLPRYESLRDYTHTKARVAAAEELPPLDRPLVLQPVPRLDAK
jgi:hypothetical protein